MPEPRIPFAEVQRVITDILVRLDMEQARAIACATLVAEASRDGVLSHGLHRFPKFVAAIRNGFVDVHARPERISGHGGLERWDGKEGPGNLNATTCMERAVQLARAHGIGAVALRNTNHWQRGGSYGWQAAEAGVIGICWTNTFPNLPPWGASVPLVGNNPLVFAVPKKDGHVVLDMAMSQFSFGALATHRMRGEKLPIAGGYDSAGQMTDDPAEIEKSGRLLPMGYWKGSGLALMLDVIAALVSDGKATHELTPHPDRESEQSQVFIAIDASTLSASEGQSSAMSSVAERVVDALHQGAAAAGENVRYPGENVLATRLDSMQQGVRVDEDIWKQILAM